MRPFVIPVSLSVIPAKAGIHLFLHSCCVHIPIKFVLVATLVLSLVCTVSSSYAVEKEKNDSTLAAQKQEKAKKAADKAHADSIDCPEAYAEGTPHHDEFVPIEVQPEVISQKAPDYPKSAKKAGVTGKVWIKCLIGEDGDVLCVRVERSSGSEELDQAAKDAAWDYKFKPALQNGKPVRVWVTYPVDFRLN